MPGRSIDLDGALTLVTGAGSGIGRATALELARRGARVIAADIDLSAAEETTSLASGNRGQMWAEAVDVSEELDVADLAKRVHTDIGTLDVLVNNAGVGMTGRLLDVGIDDWEWIMGINLYGVVHGCAAFGPPMLERGRGSVVNVASALAYANTPTEPAYAATKGAVLALTRSLRADWAIHGVGVSAVCPGVIATPITTRTRFLGEQLDPQRRHWIRRLLRDGHPPEMVADRIVSAIVWNRPMVTAGSEATLGWMLHRLLPLRVHDILARAVARR